MIARLFRSFRYAFSGLFLVVRTQQNMRLHLVAAGMAVILGALFKLTNGEWAAVLLAIGLVMAAECFNTALEKLADALHPEQHPLVGQAKDMAAGAVLCAAFAAGAVGLVVFGGRILRYLA